MPQRLDWPSAARHAAPSFSRLAAGSAKISRVRCTKTQWEFLVLATAHGWTRKTSPVTSLGTPVLHYGTRRLMKSCRKQRIIAASAAEASDSLQPQAASWEHFTQRLVAASTVPFLLLMLPQVMKNASNFMAGNARALAALSWVGYSTAYFGNLLLLAYFVTKQEREAGLIQAIGVASNAAVLTQIWAAGYMPGGAFGLMILLNLAALVITGLKVLGKLQGSPRQARIWSAWHQVLGLFGVALLPQAIWATFSGSATPLPACIAAAAGIAFLALDKAGRLPEALQGRWASVPGWTATLLFAFQPLAQAASNLSGKSDLAGVSVATLLLGMTGSGLMIPRALFMRDAVWSTGSIWGTLMSWTQLLSLFIRETPSGQRFFPGSAFAVVSVVLTAYLAAVAFKDAEAKRPPMISGAS